MMEASNWTVFQKRLLLKAVLDSRETLEFSKAEIEVFAEKVQRKPEEVEQLLKEYQNQAELELNLCINRLKKNVKTEIKTPPIEEWIRNLKTPNAFTSHQFFEALMLIAEFEEHPPAEECNGIDLQKIYKSLAASFDGLTVNLDKEHQIFIKKSLSSVRSKVMKPTKLKSDRIDFINNTTRLLPNMIQNEDLDPQIRTICSTITHNPLCIPVELLKNDMQQIMDDDCKIKVEKYVK